ncbi:MAG: LemA family protein [Pseudomonadota bacterium]
MSNKYWFYAIIALVAIFIISGINSIPSLEESVTASWSQVENQYQRRADLIPNLVATVKGYAAHEKDTLQAVVDARANATKVTINAASLSDPEAMQKFEEAQSKVTSSLSRLLAVSENYPNLKANENFIALQSQLEGTENRITVARMDYIKTVQVYNTKIRTFPGFIWAKLYDAKPKANFKATTQNADQVPNVKF